MRLARVIVDVPVQRTNRPFDYLVPDHLAPRVQIGSRVTVSFGPRKLVGYVVDLAKPASLREAAAAVAKGETDAAGSRGMLPHQTAAHEDGIPQAARLKELLEVMDDLPPLTEELVRLAEWMSRQYVCTWISCLQAMVPAVLKGRTEKTLVWMGAAGRDVVSRSPLLAELERRGVLPLVEAEKHYADECPLIPGWVEAGWITQEYRVLDKVTHKRLSVVELTVDAEEAGRIAESLPARSQGMRNTLVSLAERGGRIPLKTLIDELGVARATVNRLADKGWVRIEQVEVYRDPYAHKTASAVRHVLTSQQEEALAPIRTAIQERRYAPFVLHGVTGSGKTEVYIEAIEQTLATGREAIVLVPEISLTPQLVERFKARFGNQVAVLHSALSQGERYDEWRRIQRGEVRVAVGARSAVFAPFRNLGLILLDEEHEGSYKQEETPRYHARDVAIWRARENDAVLVLGSATPSMETYALALAGRYQLLTMKERIGGRPLPQVHLVDMRDELRSDNRSMFSRTLHTLIEDRLAKGEQMVLFLNRRGYSTFVMCRACGYTLRCPHCDISLTYHRTNHTARCHYCGHTVRQPAHCPECQSSHIRFFGTGTQKVEAELARLFPGIRVIRMDVDTTSRKGAHEELLTRFRTGQGDVLLGTQMIAKGLDFPRVTLVGVIAADTSLHLPDFRAAEKTFQLLTQVGGRAGRHELPGDVVIQTYSPEHYSILHATRHDFGSFFQQELAHRRERGYPPFYRLVLLTFAHEDVPVVIRAAEQTAAYLKPRLAPSSRLLGPVPSPIGRIKDRFRYQLMLKYRDEPKLADLLAQTAARFDDWMKQHGVSVTVDVDPYMLL